MNIIISPIILAEIILMSNYLRHPLYSLKRQRLKQKPKRLQIGLGGIRRNLIGARNISNGCRFVIGIIFSLKIMLILLVYGNLVVINPQGFVA